MNAPPKTNAKSLAPFLIKTPAQIPQTVPNPRLYTLMSLLGASRNASGASSGAEKGFAYPREEVVDEESR